MHLVKDNSLKKMWYIYISLVDVSETDRRLQRFYEHKGLNVRLLELNVWKISNRVLIKFLYHRSSHLFV